MENLAALPIDILTLIADQLPLHEIHSFASVCRQFHTAAQWNISIYKRLSAKFAKVANKDGHDGHHAEYLPDLLTKVVDEPAIGNCIRSLCIEATASPGVIMTARHPQVDRFRWELHQRAIRPFHLQDAKTRAEMDWIWLFCDDSIVIALLFYLAPQMRHLQWEVHQFSHRLLIKFLGSKIEHRLGPDADFLSRLTSVTLGSVPIDAHLPSRERATQPHDFLTLAVVCMFLPLPSIRDVSCTHVSRSHMHGEAKPRLPLPGTSTVGELKFDESAMDGEGRGWFYPTIAAIRSLETFWFTPHQSDYNEFSAVLTALAETQSGSLKNLKIWGHDQYEVVNVMMLDGTELVDDLLLFSNLKYLDTDLDFLHHMTDQSDADGQPLAMVMPSGIEYLKLRLVHFSQLETDIKEFEEMIRGKSTNFPRLNTLHLYFYWDACDGSSYGDIWAISTLTRTLYHQCKANNVKLELVGAEFEIDSEGFENLNHSNSEVQTDDRDRTQDMEAFSLGDG